MKIFDLIKLGHAHIYVHKKQSFLTVLTTGIIFGTLLGVITLFNGLENLFVRASETLGGDEVYVVSSSCMNSGNCFNYEDVVRITSTTHNISKYNGENVGKLEVFTYKNGGKSFRVIGEEYVKNLIEIDMGKYESGTLFKLISLDDAAELLRSSERSPEEPEEERDYARGGKIYSLEEISDIKSKILGEEFTETYSVPTTSLTAAASSLEGTESLPEILEVASEITYETKSQKYIVAGIVGTEQTRLALAKEYGDVKFLDLFLERVNGNVAMTDLYISRSTDSSESFRNIFEASEEDFSLPIAKFKNLDDAYAYYRAENCSLERNLSKCSSFVITELVGNRLQTKDALESVYLIFNYGGIILLLIAVAISVFTFVRLISENANSIALYRSLGASGFDILFIHLSYLVELCLITVIFAVVLGADIATIISLKDAETLSTLLTSLYSRKIDSGILIGFSTEILKVLAAILATAPLCSLLTLDQLSTKNIAKKIKE
ncbi:hypothetical protein IJ380_00675 [Candidatus Saccharibacteria bacterium]|nr:hypothetical protein [Candidatus Saccharibacteria bacterium]